MGSKRAPSDKTGSNTANNAEPVSLTLTEFIIALGVILTLGIILFAGGIQALNQEKEIQKQDEIDSKPLTSTDKAARKMKWGHIVFNTPEAMELNKTKPVRLILSPLDSEQKLKSELRTSDHKEFAKIKFTNRMEAELTGDGFKITQVTPKRQPINATDNTQWQWDIKAIEPDTQYLHLTINAVFTVDGESLPGTIRTFDRTIKVEVSSSDRFKTFMGANWQWVATTLAIPLGGWIYTLFGKRKKESNQA